MKTLWFKPWGWFYRPIHPMGWLFVCLALGFCLNVFRAIDRNSHSVSDTLYGIYPFFAPTLLGLLWLASRSSAAGRE